MGFAQRDILMRQIEMIGAWLGRQLNAAADPAHLVDEAECEAAGGLSLDVVANLPADSVISLVGDEGARLVVLALGLARRATLTTGFDRARLGTQAHALWSAGVERAPELHDDAIAARLIELTRG